MAAEPGTGSTAERDAEIDALRARLHALERDAADRTARAHAALAAAQDRSYWLERWGVDLNALMRKRGAAELRAALRALRAVYRFLYDVRFKLKGLPIRARVARDELASERAEVGAAGRPPTGRALAPDSLRESPVTDLLYGRLTEEDARAVEARLEAPDVALWEAADDADRKRLVLAFAAHYQVEPALERSGLSAAMPPPGVHSMARASAAAGGSTYYADLVVDALRATGFELEPGRSVLDFGCSSARVVRVLAAAFPEVRWHGCDPIPDAIEWAREHLPGIDFERSAEYPPLSYADGAFDCVFAVSIWSHFSGTAAVRWLAEMHRIVRPGGRLLVTTHGQQTVAHTLAAGVRSAAQLDEISAALSSHGFWYAPEFGVHGDHGVANPDWGTAFLSPEWLLAQVTPDWRLGLFAPGRVEENQDLYVLERR